MLGGTSGADAWASEASAGSRLTGAVPASGMAGVGASARSGAGVASPLGWVAVASAATGSLAVGSARGVSAGSARTGPDTTGPDTTGLETAGPDQTGRGRTGQGGRPGNTWEAGGGAARTPGRTPPPATS